MINQARIGVILAQIGTPSAPEVKSVRPYLRRFLSDRRIVDTHPLLWQPILRGIILRTRPKKSAELYRQIWTEEGSPLWVYSLRQQAALQNNLGSHYQVELGLAYSDHSIKKAIKSLESSGISRILILPMFPQYSSTTTASVYDQTCFAALGRKGFWGKATKRFIPTLRFVEPYYDDPGYIDAMKSHLERVIREQGEEGRPDYTVLTFHGIPKRYADTGDPYPQQCMETGRLLAAAMGWREEDWQISFQSRFGPEEWVGPSTEETLKSLHARGISSPMIFSPGLVTDCLETLHELNVEGREHFQASGGQPERFQFAPCLNDEPEWLSFLTRLVERNSTGW